MKPYTSDTQRLTPLTVRVDYQQALTSLEQDDKWQKRGRSAFLILMMILAASIFIPAALFIIVMVFLGMLNMLISAGVQWYTGVAPFALLALLAYLYGRGKRDG